MRGAEDRARLAVTEHCAGAAAGPSRALTSTPGAPLTRQGPHLALTWPSTVLSRALPVGTVTVPTQGMTQKRRELPTRESQDSNRRCLVP